MAASDTSQSENSAQISQLAQQFIDALHALENNSADKSQNLVQLFAVEAHLTNAALELRGDEMNGQDEILQFWQEYQSTLGQVQSKFHHITIGENGERVAGLFWTTEGVNPNGQDVHYHGCTLLEWNEQGLIQFFRGYYDTRELQLKAE